MTDMADLPHDTYMAAVADALTACGIPPQWWTSEDDSGAGTDRLDAVFRWTGDVVHPEHWPHGVYLSWDQYDGWQLIESDGPRNVFGLSQDSLVYCDPRQVAADTHARLRHGPDGWHPGPICIVGPRWDTDATYEAVTAWCAEQAAAYAAD
mgnify:CR=1 FL=1